ncbi:hypothetical protein [Streptosporangium canum]|uniref:hypothetical protein n=1 Tax=Streptosporangium canum TaxID=324952 RepID=UPI0033AF7F91
MIRLRVIKRFITDARAWRQAKRDYRALCQEGRAAHLEFSVAIHADDYEWTGLKGITGLKTVVPITPQGKRYMARVISDIEKTCIRAVLDASRREAER